MQTLKQERDAEMAALQERITHLQAQEQVGRALPSPLMLSPCILNMLTLGWPRSYRHADTRTSMTCKASWPPPAATTACSSSDSETQPRCANHHHRLARP